MFCKNCGEEYIYVNLDDPGDCWGCQKPLEVQNNAAATPDAVPVVGAGTRAEVEG